MVRLQRVGWVSALAFGALLLSVGLAQAQSSLGPLSGGGTAAAPVSEPGWLQQAYAWLLMQQAILHRELVGLMQALKRGETGALAALMVGSFGYGLFHALGPGHGKLIIGSYAFASGSAIRSSLLLTLVSSLTQALSAILLVGVLVVLIGQAQLTATRNVHWLELASYALILLLGIAMLIRSLMGKTGCCGGHAHDHTHHHGHDHAHHHGHDHAHRHGHNHRHAQDIPKRDFWAMVLSIGIRPCTGAVIVLLFTLGNGLFIVGVVSAFAMALGTAIAVGGLAVLSVLARRGGFRLLGSAQAEGVWGQRLGQGFAIAGSLAVVVMGSLLLVAAWQMPPTI